MTYNVFSGTLNSTQSINQSVQHHNFVGVCLHVSLCIQMTGDTYHTDVYVNNVKYTSYTQCTVYTTCTCTCVHM